jgi:hypothetical protein
MAQLSIIERRQLEKLFEMGGGYVLDFSNRTFEEFVADSVGAEIYNDRYHHGSGSKANRLRRFWKFESDALVGKLIRDLAAYAEFVNKNVDTDLVVACRAISDRLLAASARRSPVTPTLAAVERASEHSDMTQPIRVFISYSWDSDAHKDWVRQFADELATNGIDIILDQYDLPIGGDRFQFMEASVRDADAVLCVCTRAYVTKANGRSSGVGVETSLITPQFFERMRSAKQFIPIVRELDGNTAPTPDYLSALIFVDFRDDAQFRSQMEQLLRHLHKQPKYRKPGIGGRPMFDKSS